MDKIETLQLDLIICIDKIEVTTGSNYIYRYDRGTTTGSNYMYR
jgi:hypothetical protein